MSDLAALASPASWDGLAAPLRRWIPLQRWFQGKARTVGGVGVVDAALFDDRVVDLFVAIAYTDGATDRYQVPVVLAEPEEIDPSAVVAPWRELFIVDATTDPDGSRLLAELAVGASPWSTARGAVVEGHPVTGDAPGPQDRPRRSTAEQSNSSVIFGDRSILKVFRRLEAGINPDVEITRALTEAKFPFAPRQQGALELQAPDQEPTALVVLSDFIAGSREGWEAATTEVSGVAAGLISPEEAPVLADLVELGAAVGTLHENLRDAFGAERASPGVVTTWIEAMRDQAESVLDLAEARAPEAAVALAPRRADVFARFETLAAIRDPGPLVRVHGDLHLGQVLLGPDGRWQLLDFEGEPARPIAERRLRSVPLRDVAGMLRSFDYAAATAGTDALPEPTRRWRDLARDRFLAGYLDVAGPAGLLPGDRETARAVLAAFELDKAVYELGYELANRPSWVPIPVGGILRVLDTVRAPASTPPPPDAHPDAHADEGVPPMVTPSEGRDRPPGPQAPADRVPAAKAPDELRPAERPAAAPVGQEHDWRAGADEVGALLAGHHSDPHRLLGAHRVDSGAAVRAYRPDAARVDVLVEGADPVEAEQTAGGFFEARLPSLPEASAYRLRVAYPGDATYELRDPYAFWPTIGEIDLHLAGEGRHEELWRRMGAHCSAVDGVDGVSFAVWAPNARSVRVVGDWNSWDGRLHPMRLLGASGTWELFVPDIGPGSYYKYEIVTADGGLVTRADPYAFATDVPPGTASRVFSSTHTWCDDEWFAHRAARHPLTSPMSVYEVHLGSWRQWDGRPLGYRDLATALADHCEELGFTHVEFLPVAEHPFGGSWGYQVTGYFAPTARFGSPDDFRYLVDHLHRRGIGVIVDWVPAHFPKDSWALARFDGTALYEHADPRQGEHPDWGTLVFNFGRNEVRNFLIANALYWIEELHIDGLRVDAVASMLYLDYSRQAGEWVPNEFGGRENLEAVEFLKQFNAVVYGRNPHAMTIAEESTAWPGVSRPTYLGGLGFGFKWSMGWMHDTLEYFSKEPIYRRYHHNSLTFGFMYAWSENFILPLSHDEVVHGKRSLLDKMPGDRLQKFANLRALYGWMWAHPGKPLLFMGGEFGQWREWSEERQLDWHLLDEDDHRGLMRMVGDLNRRYRSLPALWEHDAEPSGFQWIDANNADDNTISFVRYGSDGTAPVACLSNLSPLPRPTVRYGLPRAGRWVEAFNSDAEPYGGANIGNYGAVEAEDVPWHGLPASAVVTLPPLATVWLTPGG
ncbi:hypothetical protein BH23ACT7_BH23ACT7_09520 [soil metagenome]